MKNLFLVLMFALLTACGGADAPAHSHDDEHAHDETPKGAHGGRVLSDGDIALEITIAETGTPPEFHVYATRAGKPLAPSAVQLTIELTRLGGKTDRFAFAPHGDYLKGNGTVHEPHSFDVKVTADIAGKRHTWSYQSYEGRTSIAADMAVASGIKTSIAQPGALRETLSLHGTIQPDAERVRSVVARFPGPIRSVAKRVGDSVRAGETLATIESNESLQSYAVTAPIAGVITQRAANPGESAGSEPLFVIADYSNVWAELTFFARDRARISVGQSVRVKAAEGDLTGAGVVAHIAPAAGNQTLIARVPLDNIGARWTPGLFVNGEVTLGETQVPLLVANAALQRFRDFTVVFAQFGDIYEVRMLELGRSDGEFTEVISGLDPGTTYVSANSYLIKADIEKSGASHDH